MNKAYSVLQSPLKRAIHLLAIHGEQIQEDQKLENPEFLMEIMELNEEVCVNMNTVLVLFLKLKMTASIKNRPTEQHFARKLSKIYCGKQSNTAF